MNKMNGQFIEWSPEGAKREQDKLTNGTKCDKKDTSVTNGVMNGTKSDKQDKKCDDWDKVWWTGQKVWQMEQKSWQTGLNEWRTEQNSLVKTDGKLS